MSGQERRPVTASGSLSIDMSRLVEQVAEVTAALVAARVIAYLDAKATIPPQLAEHLVQPAPTTDPALRDPGSQR